MTSEWLRKKKNKNKQKISRNTLSLFSKKIALEHFSETNSLVGELIEKLFATLSPYSFNDTNEMALQSEFLQIKQVNYKIPLLFNLFLCKQLQ